MDFFGLMVVLVSIYNCFHIVSSRCNDTSSCLGLPTCEPMMTYLKQSSKPLNRSVVAFMRSQQCGFESGYPKVCCPMTLNLPPMGSLVPRQEKNDRVMGKQIFDITVVTPPMIQPSTPFFIKHLGIDIKKFDPELKYLLDTWEYDLKRRRKRGYGMNELIEVEIR